MTEIELVVNVMFNKQLFLSPERIILLKKIKQTGSLKSAAKELSISYQNEWTIIDEMHNITTKPLVIKQRGGRGGGGAQISDYGKLMLEEYSYIELKILEFSRQLNIEIGL
jgi:molybdate transport system regulatory protein